MWTIGLDSNWFCCNRQVMLRLLVSGIRDSNTSKTTYRQRPSKQANQDRKTGYGTFAPPFATVTSHSALLSPREHLLRSLYWL
jgi:hypothetical protein